MSFFKSDARFTSAQKDEIFARGLRSNKFEDLRKNKCVDLGKRIANQQVSDEDIINEVAVLASRYVMWIDPIHDPENGELVKAIANGNAQFVIDYLNKYNSNPFEYFNAFPQKGAAPAPLYIRLSQVSDIFLTMMSNDDLSFYNVRIIIFDTFLRLFGGYFLLGADLEMDNTGEITVKRFVNIGTRYDYHEKYPEDVTVHSKEFVFSTFAQNLKYDKFVTVEISKAMKSPFPKNLSLECELSSMAKKQIKVVEEAQAAGIKKERLEFEASQAANEATKKAAQDEREAKVEAARKAFEASEIAGNAGVSVIGNKVIPVNGGRRTRRHKRSGHKKHSKKQHRSNKMRSGSRRH